MPNPHAEGASKSLKKTISEIMTHLGDTGNQPNDGLRDFLREKIGDLSERWFKKGFNRGHKESLREFEDKGKVPRVLTFECSRKLSPRQIRDLTLESIIEKKSKKSKSTVPKKRP